MDEERTVYVARDCPACRGRLRWHAVTGRTIVLECQHCGEWFEQQLPVWYTAAVGRFKRQKGA